MGKSAGAGHSKTEHEASRKYAQHVPKREKKKQDFKRFSVLVFPVQSIWFGFIATDKSSHSVNYRYEK